MTQTDGWRQTDGRAARKSHFLSCELLPVTHREGGDAGVMERDKYMEKIEKKRGMEKWRQGRGRGSVVKKKKRRESRQSGWLWRIKGRNDK